jgi:hypothetical protein
VLRLRETIEVQAPADEVWRVAGRPDRIDEFHPHVLAACVRGSLRTCRLADGSEVVERIVEHSPVHRFYTYELVTPGMLLRRYRGCVGVRGHGDHTHVDWDFELEPAREEHACALARQAGDAIAAGLERLRDRVEAAAAAAA